MVPSWGGESDPVYIFLVNVHMSKHHNPVLIYWTCDKMSEQITHQLSGKIITEIK